MGLAWEHMTRGGRTLRLRPQLLERETSLRGNDHKCLPHDPDRKGRTMSQTDRRRRLLTPKPSDTGAPGGGQESIIMRSQG